MGVVILCGVHCMCIEPHDGQSRSPMPEYSGPPVSVSFAGRDIDQAIRQPYQGQLRPTKPGSHIIQMTCSC